ncbi:uncharacterized protein BJX67DRAFT_248873 [Aspergillus lucknowensis]|uniref:non-specific serine/threonine protein kinase n=1 Tax=Aspergillus lucknowensis TaxID=176173 RepID=A0ABR4M1X6_9EURO
MASSHPQACADDTTPRLQEAGSTRTSGKRKVYGKRRADAPRAVFEQRSPVKDQQITEVERIQDPVARIQTRLAEFCITEPTVPEVCIHEKDAQEMIGPVTEDYIIIDDETSTTEQESLAKSDPVQPPSPKGPIIGLKNYQKMVEVRIAPTEIMEEPQRHEEEYPNPHHNRKRATSKGKTSRCVSSDYVSNAKANSYVSSVLAEALSPVAADGVQRFDAWAARAGEMLQVIKVAEGSYGEVYKLRLREDICRRELSKSKLARLRTCGDGVFKIVPLRAQRGLGSKKFTSIKEIVAEVRMLKYLDPIPGFARFREIHVVQGRFPAAFQKAWDFYKATKDDCLNPNPSSKRAYPDSQLWAIVEMDDAGCELEKFSWSSIFQVYDIFWGVAMALARAEEYALFEHRDLHLGNICIRSTRPDACMNPPSDAEIMRQSSSSGFGLSMLETTIIDYSLSRAELLADETSTITEVTSSDLDKKQIFDAIGRDEDDILLRDTYRHMRAQLYNGSPLNTEKIPDIPGIWAEYAPQTNLIWLRFLLKMLLKNRIPEPQDSTTQTRRQPLALCTPNKEIKKATMPGKKRSPSLEVPLTVEACSKVSQLKRTLEDRMHAVVELLDPEHGHEDMCCTADLVAFAIDAQWLDEKDFFLSE